MTGDGHGKTDVGALDVQLRAPKETGGPGGGTNPEQLFAVGYAACFQSALGGVARREKVDVSAGRTDSSVAHGPVEGGAYGIAVRLDVFLPGFDQETAERLVEAAHKVCPYSNATRGNIDVMLTVHTRVV